MNRYTSVGGVTYGYDDRGNLLSDGSRSFAYDLENHLLSVSGSGATAVNLPYDPMGRLWTSTSGGITTRYLYDGDKLVAEYNDSTLIRRYVHGAAVDEPLVWYEGAGLEDRRWLHTDHQGSVVATSDGSGVGTVYAYSAYGEPAYDNWVGSRFRYTGQIMLPEAKLYHYKARVYDPVLGRFLQTDPVGYKDDFNLYAYVRNDPFNNVDPTGRNTLAGAAIGCGITGPACAGGAIVGAIIGTAIGVGVVWVAHEATKPSDPAPSDSRPSDGSPVRDGATVETPGKTGVQDQVYGKPGGVDEANEDFDNSVDADTVKDRGGGMRTGKTPTGENITVRPGSKSGEPTVEITRGNGRNRETDKFRYRQSPKE